jgi:hypothetical protein
MIAKPRACGIVHRVWRYAKMQALTSLADRDQAS